MRGRTIARVSAWCVPALLALAAPLSPAMACPPRRAIASTADSDALFAAGILFAVFLGSLIVVAAMNVDARRSLHRRLLRERASGQGSGLAPVDATLVEKLTRQRIVRAVVLGVAALIGAGVVLATTPVRAPAPHILLLAVPIVLWVRAVAALIRGRRVLAALRAGSVETRYDGSRFIFVLAGEQLEGWLVAWPVTLQRAQADAVPTARIWN